MFRQADASSSRPHTGLGIGLALVRQLVDLHGGTVTAESILGQGAKFTIELPVTGETEQRVGCSPSIESGRLNQLRVLVVDDTSDSVEMLQQLLEMEGAVVVSARSGSDALEIAGKQDFDVVLSDISMPGMDGFEFVQRLRTITRHKDLPVIALTGFGRVEDVSRSKAEGFLSHVTKPVDISKLIEILRKLMASDGAAAAKPQP
jgi:two-component system CheB/CheR fusion protein